MIEMKNSVMDPDIKTSHLFLPMKKLFIIRDICEGTHGSLITRNNMTSDGFKHKTEWRIENETEMAHSFDNVRPHPTLLQFMLLLVLLLFFFSLWHTKKTTLTYITHFGKCFDSTVNRASMHSDDMNNALDDTRYFEMKKKIFRTIQYEYKSHQKLN